MLFMYSKIKNYNSRIDAEIDKGLLEAHNIPCIISADDAGGWRPDIMMSTGGAWLLVEKKNIDEALKLLKK